ncbi:hypothetical protein KKE26_11620 [bacterium]|nr:hypothetical protein [bacterium]
MILPIQIVLASLKAGAVIRMNTVFPDGSSAIKRLIVLTNKNEELVLALTTTSNINSPKRDYGKEDIFIKANSEKAFNLDTYIQLNRVIPINTEKIKIDYHQHELIILGEISVHLLEQVYQSIEKSELIEQKFISLILEEKIK